MTITVLVDSSSPVVGSAFGVGDGYDLDFVEKLAKNNGKRIFRENFALSPVKIRRIHPRITMDPI
jgi:hypothetical protein